MPEQAQNCQAVFLFYSKMRRGSKAEVVKEIEDFFKDIKNKSPKEIKKIKKLAMGKNIPLKEKRKLFCKFCLNPYKHPKIRIEDKRKVITCNICEKKSRWRL